MRKTVALLLFLVTAQMLQAQGTSPCIVSPVLQEHYDWDVNYLALKRIYDLQAPAMDSITIPQSYQDTIWQGLAAIFNLTANPHRDTVFDIYCIHYEADGYNVYLSYDIAVTINPNCPWYNNWKNLNIHTGVPALDALLSTYGFTITGFFDVINAAYFTTSQTLNIRRVCDSIETFNGVAYADIGIGWGDGNQIHYSKTGPARIYDFEIGWADCPSGCQDHYNIQFKVNEDCSVQYLGSPSSYPYLEPFPAPVNCNITVGMEEDKINSCIRFYPNPSSDKITVESSELSAGGRLSILNLSGQELLHRNITGPTTSIDVSHLSPGIYMVKMIGRKGVQMGKFVKQ